MSDLASCVNCGAMIRRYFDGWVHVLHTTSLGCGKPQPTLKQAEIENNERYR